MLRVHGKVQYVYGQWRPFVYYTPSNAKIGCGPLASLMTTNNLQSGSGGRTVKVWDAGMRTLSHVFTKYDALVSKVAFALKS